MRTLAEESTGLSVLRNAESEFDKARTVRRLAVANRQLLNSSRQGVALNKLRISVLCRVSLCCDENAGILGRGRLNGFGVTSYRADYEKISGCDRLTPFPGDCVRSILRIFDRRECPTNILSWLTPIAIILIMVLGGMAMANRMSWGWCIGAILGIAIAFGAPQIVTWVRGMFGV
jgi:hypothetical protein